MIRLKINKALDPTHFLNHPELQKYLIKGIFDDFILYFVGNVSDKKWEILILSPDGVPYTKFFYSDEASFMGDLAELLAIFPTTRKLFRPVEIAIGISNSSGDGGEWYTDYFDIPRDTPESIINEVAINAAKNKLSANGISVAFVLVYAIVPPEDFDTFYGEEKEYELS